MTSCIPSAGGVPGLPGPPQWWDSLTSAPRPFDASIDDPRWRGALRRGYNSGAAEEGIFRALHAIEGGTPVLYLSWHVLHDPSGIANQDRIHVMFQRGGATPGSLVRIEVNAYSSLASSYQAGDVAGISVTSRPAGGGAETAHGTLPWLAQTRGWLTLPGATTSYEWAIALRVPITNTGDDISDAGLNLGNVAGGSEFNFWYGIVKDLDDFAAAYYSPRNVKITINDQGKNDYPTTGLDSVKLGSGAGCGEGIALAVGDVGTTTIDPRTHLPSPNEFLVSATSATTNHVFARPTNTGGVIAAHSLSASFRTANWGSQADFTFAADETPWEEILPGTRKDNAAEIAAGTPGAPTQGPIEFDWTISTAEAREWLPPPAGLGTKWTHQCMLVTLSGPYDFINDSVYRNMDFVQASEFERQAEVNVRGLERLSPDNREVYLYVERSNMPRDIEGYPEEPPDVRRVIALLEDGGDHGGEVLGVPPERPTLDQIASMVPTIRFHVYHATGDRIEVGGTVKPVIEEQTSFGHFVQHDDAVWGWDVVLGGEFVKIADNFFRLEVPEGGRKVINTKVKAWEEPPTGNRPEIEPGPPQPQEPSGCLAFLFKLLPFLRKLLGK
jgi:hypothetical protein